MANTEIRIVVPLDGSQLAETALCHVDYLRKLGEVRLRLVSVVDEEDLLNVPAAADWRERERHLLSSYLEAVRERIGLDGISVETEVLAGSPAREIVASAERHGAEFLLLNTHGRSGFARWRLGSVADKVIRQATCHVLAVGPRSGGGLSDCAVRSILLPLDGSKLAEQALPVARRFATALDAHLHVVRVVTFPAFTGEEASYAWPEIQESGRVYLEEKSAELVDLHPKAALLIGSPADQLLTYAEQERISLVVLTSHGRGGLLRTALGSVADRMLGGPAPALIVRPKNGPGPKA